MEISSSYSSLILTIGMIHFCICGQFGGDVADGDFEYAIDVFLLGFDVAKCTWLCAAEIW